MSFTTLEEMVALYGASMRLGWSARAFLSKAGGLRRMALNAEVAAQHTGGRSPVFHILAKEIGELTVEARRVVEGLHQQAQTVAAKAIRSAALARCGERYDLALSKRVESATRQRLRERMRAVGSTLGNEFENMRLALEVANSALADLDRLHLQLPMIASMLRIEAHRDTATDSIMEEHAAALVTLRDDLTVSLDQTRKDSNFAMRLLASVCSGLSERA